MELDPKTPKQPQRNDEPAKRDGAQQAPPPQEIHIDHGERHGAPGREPEEPSGESEAV